jgi:DNA-binding NarL/FixJ family response regulator
MSNAKPGAIRILVVDDHPVFREGVTAIIDGEADMVLAGEARDGAEAIVRFRDLRPDVTLMDLQMPGMSGVEAIKAIRAEHPDARIVVLTTYDGDAQAVRALKAGAVGYLLKSSLRTEMVDAIHNVHRGRRHLDRGVAEQIALHVVDEPLSDREVTILRLVAIGKSNKQVAAELGLSEETVKAYLKTIFAKLDVADRTHAVTVAARRGIIDLVNLGSRAQ